MEEIDRRLGVQRLGNQIEQIDKIRSLNRKSSEFTKWKRDTEIAITSIFGGDSRHINDFTRIRYSLGMVAMSGTPESSYEKAFSKGLDDAQAILQSMVEEIEEYGVENKLGETEVVKIKSKRVFIAYGRDEIPKLEVARTLEKLGLNPIILDEQANSGLTLIEKLEAYSDVEFAVVLLTPDDLGKMKTETHEKFRARQNVIAELGYFVGKLGRKKVSSLYCEGVEIPSDFDGVAYIEYDKAGSWKFKLTKELQTAGLNVDANDLLH